MVIIVRVLTVQAFQMVLTMKIIVIHVMLTHLMIVQWIVQVFGAVLLGIVTVVV